MLVGGRAAMRNVHPNRGINDEPVQAAYPILRSEHWTSPHSSRNPDSLAVPGMPGARSSLQQLLCESVHVKSCGPVGGSPQDSQRIRVRASGNSVLDGLGLWS